MLAGITARLQTDRLEFVVRSGKDGAIWKRIHGTENSTIYHVLMV